MESLFIILIITALVIYAFSLFNTQIFNRKCFLKTKKDLENYTQSVSEKSSNFIYPNRNLDQLINNYNSKLNSDPGSFIVVKTYKFVRNNICEKTKPQIENIIGMVLNHLNNCDKMRYKYLDIEMVTKYISGCGKQLFRVVFHMYEVNKFSSRKLILDYLIENHRFRILQLNTLQSLANLPEIQGIEINSVTQYEKIDNYNDSSLFPSGEKRNKWILDNEMERLNRMGVLEPQEPCKYDLNQWDNASINTQVKLDGCCVGINHSDIILAKQPYVNPTIFQLPMPDEGIIPHTLSMQKN